MADRMEAFEEEDDIVVDDGVPESERAEEPKSPAPKKVTDLAHWILAGCMAGIVACMIFVGYQVYRAKSDIADVKSELTYKADVEAVDAISMVVASHNATIVGLQSADSMFAVNLGETNIRLGQIDGRVNEVNDRAKRADRTAAIAKKTVERLAKEMANANTGLRDNLASVRSDMNLLERGVQGRINALAISCVQADSALAANDSVRAVTEHRLSALEQVLKGKGKRPPKPPRQP